jgi:hypothetical protein
MAKIGLPENKAVFSQVADKAITLVKNKQAIFPLDPEKTGAFCWSKSKVPRASSARPSPGRQSARRPQDLLAAEGLTSRSMNRPWTI